MLQLSSIVPLLLLLFHNMADLRCCRVSAVAFMHWEVCHIATAGPGGCVAAVLPACSIECQRN